jgi:hypothetical protein
MQVIIAMAYGWYALAPNHAVQATVRRRPGWGPDHLTVYRPRPVDLVEGVSGASCYFLLGASQLRICVPAE